MRHEFESRGNTVWTRGRAPTILLVIAAGLSAASCRPFRIETPESFIELEESRRSDYAYRATTADGIVVAIRTEDNDRRGTLEFWSEAIRSKLRDVRGYAVLEERDINAQGGMPGKQIRFGRDESGHAYRYWVSLFVRHEGRNPLVWVIESGGQQDVFEDRQDDIEAMIRSFEPR